MAVKPAIQTKGLSLPPFASLMTVVKMPYISTDWMKWIQNLHQFVTSVFRYYDHARGGSATLVAGTVTIVNTRASLQSLVRMTAQNVSGTAGTLSVAINVDGSGKVTGITITSSNALDTRTIFYEIMEAY